MYPLSTLIIVFIASCYSYANAFPFMDTNPYLTNLQPNKIHSTTLLENLISFSESGENEYYPTGIEIANFLKTDIDHISYTEGRSLSTTRKHCTLFAQTPSRGSFSDCR